MAEREHLANGGHAGYITQVPGIRALGHAGAGVRLNGDDLCFLTFLNLICDEGNGHAAEVAAAAHAGDNHIGLGIGFFQL